ncbi:MAG: S-layer homology domain-containing protein, partial [Christensenella sp.]
LTVTGGTGSGDFEANATVTITANAPTSGKVFDKWTSSNGVTFVDATASTTTFTMPAKPVTVTATYKNAPVIATHTITASVVGSGGTISPSGSVTVNNGESKTFAIMPNSGYSISAVTVDGASQGAISTYTFSNVTGNHTISASFAYTAPSGGGDSGGSTGSGSTGGSSSGGTVTPPPITTTPTNPNPPTSGEIKAPATVDNNGNASVTVTDKTVADAIQKAQDEAKKNGTEKNGIAVELNVDTGKKAPNSISAKLPKAVQDSLVEGKVSEFKITSEAANLTFDSKTLQEIQKQAGGDATINASKADVSKLSKEAQNEIGNRPVFNLSITGKDGKTISDFGGGSATVSIPYTLQPNENPNNLQAFFIDAQGKLHEVACTYDPVTKCMVFVTNHFSTYGIGYKANAPKFSDIANHWAKNDIEFVTARGLLAGTDKSTFSPNSSVTTRVFAAALTKLSGKDVSTIVENSNKDAAISRQDIAVIMQNFAKLTNYNLPKLREKINFSDVTSDAITSLQMAGVIMGKDGNRFDPTATATRAEASAVLRRYVELVIDKATAQGLDMNDSGKIVYYENGKLFTGTKTIDGTTYHFGKDGICMKIDAVIPDTKKYVVHKIVRGDTLWDIAMKNKCTVAEIVGLNGIKNHNNVPIGTELKIP